MRAAVVPWGKKVTFRPFTDTCAAGLHVIDTLQNLGMPSRLWVRMQSRRNNSMDRIVAIYPGSFDPVTNGHLDLIERAAKIYDNLIVAVLANNEKEPLFSANERVEMLRESTARWPSVEVDLFHGLLVDYARKRNAHVLLRGIRAISDYEYELQMALMNRKLAPGIETVFMLPAETYSYLSSRLVKEIFRLGGDISKLVPSVVLERLRAKIT